MLCWEPVDKEGNWCHRQMVAEFMQEGLDIGVRELEIKQVKDVQPQVVQGRIPGRRGVMNRPPTAGVPKADLQDYFPYADEGCSFAPSCLNCPFTACRYDGPEERKAQNDLLRGVENASILAQRKAGSDVVAIAVNMGRSVRTIHRSLSGDR
tara:strand:+ start:897 stop:1352 length:456 start_codon:yes stop_codon:yes gene_type:complete